ncbi:MAG: Crp/Fnr family transcriptional regulator [Clostridiales bacterium]|nr:MAG: Crp/Fnr family transcriptional regulator [Clostridiales bacterium]
MEEELAIAASSDLFMQIEPHELRRMMGCLQAHKKTYRDQETIWEAGSAICQVGLVLRGRVYLESDDFWGNKSIYAEIPRGSSFGEAYALSEGDPLPFNAVSRGESAILFLDIRRMANMCSRACSCHRMMNEHLLKIIAAQTMELNRKIKHLSARTTREKLLSYLSSEAQRQRSAYISLPFNRQELADYLSVERSAMSRELGKMKAEGLIDFSRNVFALKTRG